jgi:hypothetical protein
MTLTDTEQWRPIVGYENVYEISSFGKIRRTSTGRILKYLIDKLGYRRVQLCINGICKTKKVWRLVAQAFLDDFSEDLHVDHIDGNTSNDFYANLRMASRSQNAKNRKLNCNNTTGHKGVSFHKRRQKFVARIQVDGKRLNIGEFDSLCEASAAYQAASQKHHGRFARSAV